MTTELIISTDMVEEKFRDDFWRNILMPVYDISVPDIEGCQGLTGSIRSRQLGNLLLGTTTFNAQNYQRSRRIVAQGELDQYVIQVIVAGKLRGDFDGIDVTAEAGDIVILDLTRTISSHVDAGARITIVIPRLVLEKAVGWRELHGVVLRSSLPITRLLFDYIVSLEKVALTLAPLETVVAQETLISLLASRFNTLEMGQTTANVPMRKSMIKYIETNVGDPLLGPVSLAKHFNVSRSHLYRAFYADGGVAKLIKDKRLDNAYRLILERRNKPLLLKEIAYRCGFRDTVQFTNAYRSRYNISPNETPDTTIDFRSGNNYTFSFHDHFAERATQLNLSERIIE